MALPSATPSMRFDVQAPAQHAGPSYNSKYEAHYHIGDRDRFPRAYLGATDPRDVKTGIHQTRGEALRDSYRWILDHPDFQRWRDEDAPLLWIKGDPGKGKTMLLCGIIDELEPETKLGNPDTTNLLSYFFCQATDAHLDNATAVVRGLIYMLVNKQQPSLRSHVAHKFKDTGEPLFEEAKTWAALCNMLVDIARDPSQGQIYLVVDALDECVKDQDKLLRFILQEAKLPRVKWLISSRNNVEQHMRLEHSQSILSLELQENADSVPRAIDAYIADRVAHIESLQDDPPLQAYVRQVLHEKAEGTFLWVALVVQELGNVDSWDMRQVVDDVSKGLDDLYARMIEQIDRLPRRDPAYCKLVLLAATLAYRPLQLLELCVVAGLPDAISSRVENIRRIINKSGSFLTVRDETVSFVHQSAKDTRPLHHARIGSSANAFTVSFRLSGVNKVEHFVAREEELVRIHRQLALDKSHGSQRRCAVVHGLGGMGKTQLAIAYAKRHRDDYSAIFWLNARDETSLKQGFLRAAQQILDEHAFLLYIKNAIEGRDLDEAVQAVKRWLNHEQNDSWLLVYDNYDSPKLEGGGSSHLTDQQDPENTNIISKDYDIRSFFPDAYHGSILVTTRSSAVRLGGLVPLSKLRNVKDGLEILSHESGRENLQDDPQASQLARRLDGLPLALATAGAYLSNVSTGFGEYLELYDRSWSRLQRTSPSLLSYEDRRLYSTWDISFAQVELQNRLSAMLLRQWAYFDGDDLWFELLREGHDDGPQWLQQVTADMLSFNEAVRVLCSYGLVEADTSARECGSESRGYGMHGCVHAWTMHALNETQNMDMARLAIDCVGSHVPADTEHDYWITQRRLLQHADHCIKMVTENVSLGEGCESALHQLGGLYINQGRLDEAEAMYSRALQGYVKALGPDHTSTLDTVNNLGLLFANQGRLDEADAMYSRALQGFEKALGPDHTSTLSTVNNLGNLFRGQGRLDEAEAMYSRAFQGYEKALGLKQADRYVPALNTCENLADLYVRLGRMDDALALYTRCQAGLTAIFGSQHKRCQAIDQKLGSLN